MPICIPEQEEDVEQGFFKLSKASDTTSGDYTLVAVTRENHSVCQLLGWRHCKRFCSLQQVTEIATTLHVRYWRLNLLAIGENCLQSSAVLTPVNIVSNRYQFTVTSV